MTVFDYIKKKAPRKLQELMGCLLWVVFYMEGSHRSKEFAKTYSFTPK